MKRGHVWTVRTLARELRLAHAAVPRPTSVWLDWEGYLWTDPLSSSAREPFTTAELVGWPGFDAMRSARRLLARWRDLHTDRRQLELFE